MDDEDYSYELTIQGRLDPRWEAWFDGMTLSVATGDFTILTGVVDQVTLRGTLNKLWDLNLTLVSVKRRKAGAAE